MDDLRHLSDLKIGPVVETRVLRIADIIKELFKDPALVLCTARKEFDKLIALRIPASDEVDMGGLCGMHII